MSQAEARSWWADVEHLREAAERRQAAESARRATRQRAAERRERRDGDLSPTRARARAASRVVDVSGGVVDELTARRAVTVEERAPRVRRPAPIWLADDELADPIARARARAAAPRRTIEIRGQVDRPPAASLPQRPGRAGETEAGGVATASSVAPLRRPRPALSFADTFAARPDRLAFWAFALGLTLALIAALSGGQA